MQVIYTQIYANRRGDIGYGIAILKDKYPVLIRGFQGFAD
jgi:hypothetical protein